MEFLNTKIYQNNHVINGYVEQNSPCCAAAVVSGCLNSLAEINNLNPLAIKNQEVLDQYASIFYQRIYKYENTFKKFNKLFILIDDYLEDKLTKDKKVLCKKIDLLIYSEIRKIDKSIQNNWINLRKFYLRNDCSDNTLLSIGKYLFIQDKRCIPKFRNLVTNIRRYKLLTKERPSTAPIGNWGILKVIKIISQNLNMENNLKSKKLLNLSDLNYQELLWKKIKDTFLFPKTVLIFHLKNHYSLIYSLKEVYDSDNNLKDCLLLISKKGQSPKDWVNLDFVIDTLKGWKGYNIIAVSSETNIQDKILNRNTI